MASETTPEIIAEMRIFKCRNLESGELELCMAIAHYFADRLEAAHRREKATAEKSSLVGNAAKMREALTDLVDYLNKEVERTSKCKGCEYKGTFRGEPCYSHVDCDIEPWDVKASNNAKYLLKKFKLQEALAAPPRNCDRPECKDIRSAMIVYRRECCEDGPLYARKEGAMREADWLLAPAEGREGGAE